MEEIEIWPDGDIDFGTEIIDGERIIAMRCVDGDTGRVVVLAFNFAAFVSVVDHAAMVADRFLDGNDPQARPN